MRTIVQLCRTAFKNASARLGSKLHSWTIVRARPIFYFLFIQFLMGSVMDIKRTLSIYYNILFNKYYNQKHCDKHGKIMAAPSIRPIRNCLYGRHIGCTRQHIYQPVPRAPRRWALAFRRSASGARSHCWTHLGFDSSARPIERLYSWTHLCSAKGTNSNCHDLFTLPISVSKIYAWIFMGSCLKRWRHLWLVSVVAHGCWRTYILVQHE